ncbi:hypothetical protein NECAME_19118, partial [Necator americanus]
MQESSTDILTQEELDHIAYIQRLAEESSSGITVPDTPTHTMQQSSSAMIEPEKHMGVTDTAKNLFARIFTEKYSTKPTQAERDHTAHTQRLAEESSPGITVPAQPPFSQLISSRENENELEEESEATSGADHLSASDLSLPEDINSSYDSLYAMQQCKDGSKSALPTFYNPGRITNQFETSSEVLMDTNLSVQLYETGQMEVTSEETEGILPGTSALILHETPFNEFAPETSVGLPSTANNVGIGIPKKEANTELTQGELDHTAYMQRLAEKALFGIAEPAMPTHTVSGSSFEATTLEKTSKSAEGDRAMLTKQPGSESLTQEELDHIAHIQRLAEESLFGTGAPVLSTTKHRDSFG